MEAFILKYKGLIAENWSIGCHSGTQPHYDAGYPIYRTKEALLKILEENDWDFMIHRELVTTYISKRRVESVAHVFEKIKGKYDLLKFQELEEEGFEFVPVIIVMNR